MLRAVFVGDEHRAVGQPHDRLVVERQLAIVGLRQDRHVAGGGAHAVQRIEAGGISALVVGQKHGVGERRLDAGLLLAGGAWCRRGKLDADRVEAQLQKPLP